MIVDDSDIVGVNVGVCDCVGVGVIDGVGDDEQTMTLAAHELTYVVR